MPEGLPGLKVTSWGVSSVGDKGLEEFWVFLSRFSLTICFSA